MKRPRLLPAERAGWLAEFPRELWAIIVAFAVGTNADHMDVATALTLASLSHAHCQLVWPHCATLLRLILMRPWPSFYKGSVKRLSEQVHHLLWEVPTLTRDRVRAYMAHCLATATVSPGQVTNVLSLVNFVKLERRGRLHQEEFGHRLLKRADNDVNVCVRRVVYFDGTRARPVGKMKNLVVCYDEPERLIEKALTVRSHRDLLLLDNDGSARLSRAIEILHEHDKLEVYPASRPLRHMLAPVFKFLMLRSDVAGGGVRYDHVLGEQCREFRRACFVRPTGRPGDATLACKLTLHHTRNWRDIQSAERFAVTPVQ